MISYAPLWKTLKEKGQSTYTLIFKHGISAATINKMKHNGGITTAKIDDLCKMLDCRVEDIVEYIKDE